MRLRTLPVSLAGVVTAAAYAVVYAGASGVRWMPVTLCFIFALLCQIASNFANEYYDFRAGFDRRGREGPRRGVTEGDITPRSMKLATYLTLAAGCLTGLALTLWGGLWLIAIGAVVVVGVVAYSAGPYPLSHHGLGEVAVVFFFGIIPVCLTFYLATGVLYDPIVALGSLAVGLMGANVLVVNNYRDREDDAAVGKKTLAVVFGRGAMQALYLINGLIAAALVMPVWGGLPGGTAVPLCYVALVLVLFFRLRSLCGAALNPLLGQTAVSMALYAIAFLVCALLS